MKEFLGCILLVAPLAALIIWLKPWRGPESAAVPSVMRALKSVLDDISPRTRAARRAAAAAAAAPTARAPAVEGADEP
jgi:hypothetical protein